MNMVDRSVLEKVTRPVGSANGLPNAFYTDPSLFETERKQVFERNWTCIGFGKNVPEPGDARPVNFMGIPLLVLRTKDGIVKVFQNVCRHRGMILVNEPTKLKGVIRCPYHSWCYSHDGDLVTTPHVGGAGQNTHESIKRDELGLFEVRAHVWMDCIFVNISGDAPAFEDYAAKAIERWKEFESRPLFHGGPDSSFTLDVKSNWKLPVENYCESYHLPWIHPGLNSYSKLEDHYNIVEPQAYSGQGTTVYNPQLDDSGRHFPRFDNLSSKWDSGAEYVAFYPNLQLGVHKDHTFAILLEPVSQDRTLEHIEIYYTSPDVAGDDWDKMRKTNTDMWKEVFAEDVFVVEGMQRGRSAPGFDGGKFSPAMDPATHCFHDWVARQYDAPGP